MENVTEPSKKDLNSVNIHHPMASGAACRGLLHNLKHMDWEIAYGPILKWSILYSYIDGNYITDKFPKHLSLNYLIHI